MTLRKIRWRKAQEIRSMRKFLMAVPLVLFTVPAAAQQAAAPQADDMNRVMDQGLQHSHVMQTAEYLMDSIGGRLTNSPQMRQAEGWTQAQFRSWGLKNVHKEGFPFGRGWSIQWSSVRMVMPRVIQLTAMPLAWTPGTNGTIRAPIVVAPMKRERDFEPWRGKLAGKVVLVSLPGDGDEPGDPAFKRLKDDDIHKLDRIEQPDVDPAARERQLKRFKFRAKLDAFLKSERAVAWVRKSYRDGKLLHGESFAYRVGDTPALPGIEVAAEDYRRLARLAKVGPAPTIEINSTVKFDDSDINAYNIFGEIPGSDPRAGYVMAGAHLDSWVAGDGAADNGAGTAVVMEAARILATIGIKPRRTIRFALWAGEEQGCLGSLSYVEKYLATRIPANAPDGNDQWLRWDQWFPIKPRPGYKDLVAYFNIDNGSGKVRGIHAEGNVAAVPLLREWLQPFASMGANAVVASPTRDTDHEFMQAVGVPGYQFVQDPLDYSSRIHHSSIDTFDHLKAEDMRQASVILAGLLLQSANSDKTLPRMPLPTQSAPTNPFKYEDPSDD
ncbi:M20/M25/M40 family metallo-hydrolase [Pendulispora albinea]|uniref:Carboxypeptidase Q n=1 Tax=Pendulispora albinea TaxID=2741071 RepID=A0ABZ2LYF9_9BACT